MTKRIAMMLGYLMVSSILIGQTNNLLIGSYMNENGDRLAISGSFFQFEGGDENPLVFGNQDVPGPSGGLFSYYIKPTYRTGTDWSSLVNLQLQRGDDAILAIYLLHYDQSENTLTFGIWDVFSGRFSTEVFSKVGDG